ncbi:universal stress protein [Enterobacter soli]|jgi:universal stress protein G|uniref:Universal stress protein n=1 Tax=Enterobacter soli TaxID=885040 RepID=A0AAW8H5A6_9ENTR|nr:MULTISPECIES: universal stress protein [Enterobacter]AEN64747.1 UspA domain-containing protein [Enterobacter soli]MCR1320506.1 universal stress protein [Enterobacter soli]MDD9244550.1 universal stress protein [Enterobacter soli]MDQ2256003.1 universal stress protein [Enterobacter soli]MDQ2337564.1 universal stress protein [Enterobacter soli]
MYKNILMPVDVFEMDLSDKAVRHAANLAKEEGAAITLVNILPSSSRSLLRGFNADIKKFEEYMTNESEKKMSELKRLFDIAPENIHCTVRFGNVRDEIIAMSKEGEYDIIVIGSKNPSITTHLLGSNAESILRYARIPVLVVR